MPKAILKEESTASVEGKVWQVPVDKLKPSAYQPRTHFDRPALEELAQSIKSSGLLQPIIVRKSKPEGTFEIVAGERRWRASQIAGLHDVPVIVKSFDDRQTLELALIENIQREDLNPIEEAEAYQRLANEFSLTQQQVAEKVGKDRASVANAMRLLTLPTELRDMLQEKQISVGHAKVLLSIADTKIMKSYALKIKDDRLTVRQLERILKQSPITMPAPPNPGQDLRNKMVEKLREELQRSLKTKVGIEYDKGKGKLTAYFYSDDELNSLAERLQSNV